MTRRFRMGLFLCLAAATGLHLRPCLWTIKGGCEPEPSAPHAAPAPEMTVAQVRGRRPSLGDLSAGPALVGIQAAVAETR